ncbi:RING-type domain-containing protein [Caenorhabditis elegans]|uniref:RING-type domain-containing protein n=1 Tax=Caenorhabditis elegans TaxID=6239 RepID=Q9XW86_CAEEL|nr:RING-type domain-containing protein [Caenorhabditis elegans]CAA22083.2 RING-type domain-containing protein [Caenorhabditis elegans]|eukprot:NP_499583.1 Uncharacterized protein CELE_Y75B8A.10 [Caenorhabditis elegans]
MDVMNLPESDARSPVCAVADDILGALEASRTNHFSIYIVFKANMVLKKPFKLLYHTELKSVTDLSAKMADSDGAPIWDFATGPRPVRSPGHYVKLDFFDTGNKEVTCRWSDSSMKETLIHQGTLAPPPKDYMKLLLILPVEEASVQVMPEKSYGAFELMRKFGKDVPQASIGCPIGFTCSTPKAMLRCSHVFCETCLATASKWDFDGCPVCRAPDTDFIRLKLRHGPCPFDLCCSDEDSSGVVLIPCGCRVPCKNLEMAYDTEKNNIQALVDLVRVCPYEVCKQNVASIQKPFLFKIE